MHAEDIDPAISEIIPTLCVLAASEEIRGTVKKTLNRPGTRLLIQANDDCLFSMSTFMREEYPEYQVFVMGHLLEVRRVGLFSNEYSFIKFPSELATCRQSVEHRFVSMSVLTDEGMGWFEPGSWEDLTEEQRAICKPQFVEDNIRYFSL